MLWKLDARRTLSVIYVGLLYSFVAHGQLDFSVPSDWQKPDSPNPRSQRLSIAQAAIDPLISNIDPSNGTVDPLNTWQSANVLASIAQLDYVSGAQDHRDVFKTSLAAFQSGHPTFFDTQVPLNQTSDPLMWGLAAFYGFRAYNASDLLEIAEGVWNTAQTFFVTADEAAKGTHPTKNGSFPANCIQNSNTIATGAVFARSAAPDDFSITIETAGAYVALSAHLWESTGNITYLTFADLSTSFMYNYMFNNEVFIDTYDLMSCQVSKDALFSYNQGFVIEGLLILSTSPLPSNTSRANALRNLIITTVPFSAWTTVDGENAGVMNETSSISVQDNEVAFDYKNIFINALFEVWKRANSSDPMATYIQAFIMVQYNALLSPAVSQGNVYSPIWVGRGNIPPQPVPWGQLEAMPVLNAAIGIPPTSNSSSSSPAGSSPASAATTGPSSTIKNTSSSSLSGGSIAGIAVGAIAGVVVMILGGVLVVRRSRRVEVAASDIELPESEGVVVEPFTLTAREFRRPLGTGSSETDYVMPAGYARKNGQGLGLAASRTESSVSASVHPGSPPSDSSAEVPTPADINESSITRMIHQVLSRMQVQEAPPAYN
ncbi:hypothetical protein PENSPDRAFT_753334 [Peniophora sp. CONT]|nr:hypothetical protein PENSPDRAFT_753334 [Peniophora sp. CONT]